ncbi:MAG TPA: prolyl aminopeptidase [Acidimicrobiia bacterium]|nr:prolyl aminopeptidase [Acidimicrobiia bacterium]
MVEIEPYATGVLETSDGHAVYWECVGNPTGAPVVYLHGGPGSGCTPGQRNLFDPAIHRAVLFDQRGSGRSQPLASDPGADLGTNTTSHLIEDMEALRRMLEIDSWTVLGMSWGTTLGLAYAQRHAERVDGLVLALVTTTSRREVDWMTEGVGRIFPVEWHRFASAVPEGLRDRRLVDAYAAMLGDPDPEIHGRAAVEWCTWEDAHVSLDPGFAPNPRFEDAEFRLRFARLVTHYWRNAAFLDDDQLIREAATLNGIPGSLIHGRYDVSSPLETPWQLAREWTTSELHVLGNAGHGGGEAMLALVRDALGRFARR